MKHILNIIVAAWARFAGVLPDYSTDIILAKWNIKRWIRTATTTDHLDCCERAINNIEFNYTLAQSQEHVKELLNNVLIRRCELISSETLLQQVKSK